MEWAKALATRSEKNVHFQDWIGDRSVPSLGTNAGTSPLPFQTWHRFKEAFAPELVARAVRESSLRVKHLLDAFGGSGTSALSAQFLGVKSTAIEVNPFLADVISAKTARYDSSLLVYDLGRIAKRAMRSKGNTARFQNCPATFIEPGKNGRYLFSSPVAERIAAIIDAIDSLRTTEHKTLFRVLLAGILAGVSNVCVSGKGRRYRGGWQSRPVDPANVLSKFIESATRAVVEIHAHEARPVVAATVIHGDSRKKVRESEKADLVVFSPPYPNSFDYTDVYNIELWMLGYLSTSAGNQQLRRSTLSSHVQIKREFARPPTGSRRLTNALGQLRKKRELLWSPWIPEMVGGYFADMGDVLRGCAERLRKRGQVWMVVGDSRYADTLIPVDKILIDLASDWGLSFVHREPFRSMRASPQQGGGHELAESLVILAKD